MPNDLTKRDLFAAFAMMGIWANPHDVPGKRDGDTLYGTIARFAYQQADAMLKESTLQPLQPTRPGPGEEVKKPT